LVDENKSKLAEKTAADLSSTSAEQLSY